MPTNVTNKLTALGEPENVQRFFATVYGGRDDKGREMFIDFNRIKPIPEAMNVSCGSRSNQALELYLEFIKEKAGIAEICLALGDRGATYTKRMTGDLTAKYAKVFQDDPDLLKFGEQLFNNIRDYGAPTWHEWCTENWGTKWNAFRQERIDDNTIRFDTAWSGVPGLIQELSRQFPGMRCIY